MAQKHNLQHHPCRCPTKWSLQTVYQLALDYPPLLTRLPAASHDAYFRICASLSHVRSRKTWGLFMELIGQFESIASLPHLSRFLAGAVNVGAMNWSMIEAYFIGAKALVTHDGLWEEWLAMAMYLTDVDVDVGAAFLINTPQALETFGPERILAWGGLALQAVSGEPAMWKAAQAYLNESANILCATPPTRWSFFLAEAIKIARVSVNAAESFIRSGARTCLLLTDQETEQWVAAGLQANESEGELCLFFGGGSLLALETRDRLASGAILKDQAGALSLMSEAYLGRTIRIRDNLSLLGIEGFAGGSATDGRTVYLPPTVPDFDLFKLMTLHQAAVLTLRDNGHIEEKASIHVQADRILLDKLPGLRKAMAQWAEGLLPPEYPEDGRDGFQGHFIWWGDHLPDLAIQTEEVIQRLTAEACQLRPDLPSTSVESMLAGMMADGVRDQEELWDRLLALFESIDLTTTDPDEMEDNFQTFTYKEWDAKFSDYKLGWCLVRERPARAESNEFVEEVRERLAGLIKLIRRQFMMLKPDRFKKYRRQESGDNLDIDALVEALVEKKSGAPLSDKVYIRRDKKLRDVAVLFLVDLSGSTRGRVNGHRVIDLQKEAMVLMAEALNSLGDPFAILGFSTEGRLRVDIFTVKDFHEEYDQLARYRLGGLEPKDFTRLGAVIRHGAHKFKKVAATIKLMIILTDGRPYDEEYGDLDYAIADTKKALREVQNQRINPFIITSDQKGADYLKLISPTTQAVIAPNVEALPLMLPTMYKRLTT